MPHLMRFALLAGPHAHGSGRRMLSPRRPLRHLCLPSGRPVPLPDHQLPPAPGQLRRLAVFAIVLVLLAGAGCSGSRKKEAEVEAFLRNSASYYVKKGSDAVAAGDYQGALHQFRQAIALTPFDPVAHNDMGVAFYHLGQLDSALAYYQTAIRLRPDYLRAISNLSKTYLDLGQTRYALAAAERLLELDPASATAHLLQAEIYGKSGRIEEAITATRDALKADSSDTGVHNNLGVLYFRSGRIDEAVECYRRILEQDSTVAAAWFNLGNALARKCLLVEAQFNYRRALAHNPAMTSAANNHGLVYLFMDQLVAADRDFHRALATDSTAAPVHFNLSIVRTRLDSLPAALTSVRRAIALQPGMANFYLQQGMILERIGQADSAAAALERAIALDSTLSAGYNSLGNIMAESKPELARQAYEKALANYDEFILRRYGRANEAVEQGYFDLLATCKENWQIQADHAMVYNNLGKVYLQLNQFDEAAAAFDKAVELQPELWEPAENLAVVRFAQKRDAEGRELAARGRLNRARAALRADSVAIAEKLVQEAMRLQPRLAGGHALLAQIHERKGDVQKAEATYRAGLRLHPREHAIHHAYGRFLNRQERNREAREQLLAAIAIDPSHEETRYLLGGIYHKLGEPEKAEEEFAAGHYLLGRGYERAGYLDRAMEEYRMAARMQPLQLDYLASQGLIFLKKRLSAEAEALFRSVLGREERNPVALYGMGLVQGERGQHDQAVAWLQAALAERPEVAEVHRALAVSYYYLGQLDLAREQALKARALGAEIKAELATALNIPEITPR